MRSNSSAGGEREARGRSPLGNYASYVYPPAWGPSCRFCFAASKIRALPCLSAPQTPPTHQRARALALWPPDGLSHTEQAIDLGALSRLPVLDSLLWAVNRRCTRAGGLLWHWLCWEGARAELRSPELIRREHGISSRGVSVGRSDVASLQSRSGALSTGYERRVGCGRLVCLDRPAARSQGVSRPSDGG